MGILVILCCSLFFHVKLYFEALNLMLSYQTISIRWEIIDIFRQMGSTAHKTEVRAGWQGSFTMFTSRHGIKHVESKMSEKLSSVFS